MSEEEEDSLRSCYLVTKYRGVFWVDNHGEISDLLNEGKIEGPLETIKIEKTNFPFVSSGCRRCNKAALKIAKEKCYPIIYSRGLSWWRDLTTIGIYKFYKFKDA